MYIQLFCNTETSLLQKSRCKTLKASHLFKYMEHLFWIILKFFLKADLNSLRIFAQLLKR